MYTAIKTHIATGFFKNRAVGPRHNRLNMGMKKMSLESMLNFADCINYLI